MRVGSGRRMRSRRRVGRLPPTMSRRTFEVLDGLVVVVIANATTTLSGVLIPPWRHRAQEIGAKLRLSSWARPSPRRGSLPQTWSRARHQPSSLGAALPLARGRSQGLATVLVIRSAPAADAPAYAGSNFRAVVLNVDFARNARVRETVRPARETWSAEAGG